MPNSTQPFSVKSIKQDQRFYPDGMPGRQPGKLRQRISDPGKVKVSGSGLTDGVLGNYNGDFTIDISRAGPGSLLVQTRGLGKTGASEVTVPDTVPRSGIIPCLHTPTEAGEATIYIKWSGVDIPGSPFYATIFENEDDYLAFKSKNPYRRLSQQEVAAKVAV